MFVVVVLYCVQMFFFWDANVHHYLYPLLWSSYCKLITKLLFRVIRMHHFHNISNSLLRKVMTHSTQTIFQGGSPWAALILNSMFVVVVLYCVKLFCWSQSFPKSFSPFRFLSVSFPLLINSSLFYFLSSILLEFSKMSNFQNIGCFIKTQ